jgi:hypothetical protein
MCLARFEFWDPDREYELKDYVLMGLSGTVFLGTLGLLLTALVPLAMKGLGLSSFTLPSPRLPQASFQLPRFTLVWPVWADSVLLLSSLFIFLLSIVVYVLRPSQSGAGLVGSAAVFSVLSAGAVLFLLEKVGLFTFGYLRSWMVAVVGQGMLVELAPVLAPVSLALAVVCFAKASGEV